MVASNTLPARVKAAVDTLTSSVNSALAKLQPGVDAAPTAEAARDAALGYRDEAQTARDLSQTYSQNAASAVAYQDLTGLISSIAKTAVDLIAYDTSLDSDGGAWRHRCQHTSWYREALNTATRGATREFPAVALIVATASDVTIYDATDPALPMWMVFNSTSGSMLRSGSITSIAILNGTFCVSHLGGGGLHKINFITDNAYWVTSSLSYGGAWLKSGIADRNLSGANYRNNISVASIIALVDSNLHRVAITALSDAPVDPATSLPIPTIAVGTEGGVSIIHNTGDVADIVHSDSPGIQAVAFSGEGHLWYEAADFVHVRETLPTSDEVSQTRYTKGNSDWFYPHTPNPAYAGADAFINSAGTSGVRDGVIPHAIPRDGGLTLLEGSLVAYIASDFATGWLVGVASGAWLSDTDATDLIGAELGSNGSFDADVSGWSPASDGRCSVSWQSGKLRVVNDTAGYGYAYQTISTVVGQTYVIEWDVDAPGAVYSTRVFWGAAEASTSGGASSAGTALGKKSITFVATTTTVYLTLQLFTASVGASVAMDFDNLSVRLADADRTVNNKGLIANGIITKTPVAPGADLVAYSGFSATNYLEQPYNPDLDFGTDDFCVMGWVKWNSAGSYGGIFHRTSGAAVSSSGTMIAIISGGGGISAYVLGTGMAISNNKPAGSWQFVALIRENGVCRTYLDGKKVQTISVPGSVTDANAVSYFGGYYSSGIQAAGSNVALVRVGPTAPTPEQIAKIYEDERRLFQPGAQATLFGTSNAVTALSEDPVRGLLHAGTSAGRSVFQGLARAANTTTPVTTAISAVDDLVMEQ